MNRNTETLRNRLQRAEEVLEAIRTGQVDAVVGKEKIVLLKLHEMEQELRHTQELLRVAVETGKLASWAIDLNTGRLLACPRLKEMFGLSAMNDRQFQRKSLSLLFEEDRKRLMDEGKRAVESGDGFEIEFRIRRQDGEIRWLRSQSKPVKRKNHLVSLIGNVADITESKLLEFALRDSLMEKELLLREVHHRVKNNLAVVCALLDMQQQVIEDPAVAMVLKELEIRIRSIVLVHEQLYRSQNLSRIIFQDYITTLLHDLRSSFGADFDVRCITKAQGIEFGIDTAIPCGMIINELVTNAIKHAFPDGMTHDRKTTPEITVEVNLEQEFCRIVVADNGVGFPREVDLHTSRTFGLRLVNMIGIHQLQGSLELDRRKGTRITFVFKDSHKETQ